METSKLYLDFRCMQGYTGNLGPKHGESNGKNIDNEMETEVSLGRLVEDLGSSSREIGGCPSYGHFLGVLKFSVPQT